MGILNVEWNIIYLVKWYEWNSKFCFDLTALCIFCVLYHDTFCLVVSSFFKVNYLFLQLCFCFIANNNKEHGYISLFILLQI